MAHATSFLDAPFHPSTLAAACAQIVSQASRLAPFRYVVTPNVDHVLRLNEPNPEMTAVYAGAWRSFNDSRVLELLARQVGLTLPVAAGSDIVEKLFAEEIDPGEPVTIIGGSQATIDGLRRRYGLTDIRWCCPPMGLRDKPEAMAEAARFASFHRSRFVFIALGSPQQEMVARVIADRGDSYGVGLCVGAGLDFLAGVQKRAPAWVREARLEWAFRLASEPQRLWRRYLVEGPRIFGLWLSWARIHGPVEPAVEPVGGATFLAANARIRVSSSG